MSDPVNITVVGEDRIHQVTINTPSKGARSIVLRSHIVDTDGNEIKRSPDARFIIGEDLTALAHMAAAFGLTPAEWYTKFKQGLYLTRRAFRE